jgi:quercetin dioxygenase-like cupin family protein
MANNSSLLKIQKWDTVKNGALSGTAMMNLLERQGYRCTQYTYPAGTCFPEHSHSLDKIDAVLKGRFKITMGGKSFILSAGDYVYIPANTPHSAEVVGNESVVSIDAIKTS